MKQVMQLLKLPDVQLAIAAMSIGQMVMTLLMVVTPLHMNRADYKADAISYVLMAHTLGMFGLSGLSGWLGGARWPRSHDFRGRLSSRCWPRS